MLEPSGVRGLVRHRQPAPLRPRDAGPRRRPRAADRGRAGRAASIPVRVVAKPVLTGSDGIRQLAAEANADPACVGLITWMHTFSPAKMWIAGLQLLAKPFLHLHTQYNREIPWADIDMDFMNLNQAAHGDREFGFIAARLRIERKVVVGHWGDAERPGRDRHLDARRVREGRLDDRQDRAHRRQHARGRRHRGRQGRGPAPPRLQRQHLGRGRPRRGRRRGVATRDVDELVARYLDEYDVAAELRPGRRPRVEPARRGADRARPAAVPRGRRLHRVHRHVRGPPRPQAAARPRGPAAHGRRLRVRRRGGLEDRVDGPGHEGHDRRPRRAASRSWRTTPTT